MIHARVDTAEHRKIVGFEVGTRTQFDNRHGGDPVWFFLDSYRVKSRADESDFLTYPWKYMINEHGDLILSDEPPITDEETIPEIMVGYAFLKGRDGRYLRGDDGAFILGYDVGYYPPPEGFTYLLDPDNAFLKDPDDHYLIEEYIPPVDVTVFLTDVDGAQLTDLDEAHITE